MKRWLMAAALVLALLVGPAFAQQLSCGPRGKTLEGLAQDYGARPVARALTANGCVLEILASPSGTWTTLVTCPHYPTDLVCWGNSGTGWESLEPVEAKPGRGA